MMAIISMASCVGMKTGSSQGSSPSVVKMFNKGKDSLLCHAGPVQYEALNCKDEFEVDYTYLKVKGQSNPVTCNFSLISDDATFRPASVIVKVDRSETKVDNLEKFFAEGFGKRHYKYRYSFQIPDSVFFNMMKSEDVVITVNDRSFAGKRDHEKKSQVIFRSMLFDLYN